VTDFSTWRRESELTSIEAQHSWQRTCVIIGWRLISYMGDLSAFFFWMMVLG